MKTQYCIGRALPSIGNIEIGLDLENCGKFNTIPEAIDDLVDRVTAIPEIADSLHLAECRVDEAGDVVEFQLLAHGLVALTLRQNIDSYLKAKNKVQATETTSLVSALTRLAEKTKRAITITNDGSDLDTEDWVELHDITGDAFALLDQLKGNE